MIDLTKAQQRRRTEVRYVRQVAAAIRNTWPESSRWAALTSLRMSYMSGRAAVSCQALKLARLIGEKLQDIDDASSEQ